MEPGPTWYNALIKERKVDYLFHYIAQKYLCDDLEGDRFILSFPNNTKTLEVSNELQQIQYTRFGDDLLVRGHLY